MIWIKATKWWINHNIADIDNDQLFKWKANATNNVRRCISGRFRLIHKSNPWRRKWKTQRAGMVIFYRNQLQHEKSQFYSMCLPKLNYFFHVRSKCHIKWYWLPCQLCHVPLFICILKTSIDPASPWSENHFILL